MLILTEEGQEEAYWRAGFYSDGFLAGKKAEYEKVNGDPWCIPAVLRRQPGKRGAETEAAEAKAAEIEATTVEAAAAVGPVGSLGQKRWEVGFPFPWLLGGRRIRLSSTVEQGDIVKVLTPFDILDISTEILEGRWGEFMSRLAEWASLVGVKAGLYGSAAMEVVSGLPYLHRDSDLDLTVTAATLPAMKEYYLRVQGGARKEGIPVDMEIRLEGVGDVKAWELFSRQRTIMVRTKTDIKILDRKNIEKMMNKK